MTKIFVPFDNNPVASGGGTSYTCPAGKYALVHWNLSSSVYVDAQSVSTNWNLTSKTSGGHLDMSFDTNSDSSSGSMWVKAGDAITTTTSSGFSIASISVTTGTGTQESSGFLNSLARVYIGGTEIARSQSYGSSRLVGHVVSAGTYTAQINMAQGTYARLAISEYNIAT